MTDLNGKSVLITGAASGIGRLMARITHREVASIASAGYSAQKLGASVCSPPVSELRLRVLDDGSKASVALQTI